MRERVTGGALINAYGTSGHRRQLDTQRTRSGVAIHVASDLQVVLAIRARPFLRRGVQCTSTSLDSSHKFHYYSPTSSRTPRFMRVMLSAKYAGVIQSEINILLVGIYVWDIYDSNRRVFITRGG